MKMDKKLATSKITPELIDYIVRKIVKAIYPRKNNSLCFLCKRE